MKTILLLSTLTCSVLLAGANPQLQSHLDALAAEAKQHDAAFAGFSAEQGKAIFTTKQIGKAGKPIACTACHTTDLRRSGENAKTGKTIEPLAPSANAKSLTDVKNVKKWLRRNFNDVYGRVGTAREKGDVLTYIVNQ